MGSRLLLNASSHQVQDERKRLFLCLKQSHQEGFVRGVGVKCARNTLAQEVD